MRFNAIRLGFLLALGCFLSLNWINSSLNKKAAHPDVGALHKRLCVAEKLGEQISRDLSRILEQMRKISRAPHVTNTTTAATVTTKRSTEKHKKHVANSTIILSNIQALLPHLTDHPDSLTANIVVGVGRHNVPLVIAIPTVKRRKQSYLLNTLSSLIYNLTPSQQREVLIVVFIGETDSAYVDSVAETIKKRFQTEVQAGMLQVISPSPRFYPDLTNLRETFGDSKERVRWRTKQNLDFSFLMLYATHKGTYYLQLEDDIVAKENYYNSMMTYITQKSSEDWLFLEFSQLGFIGKLFRTRDLPMIAEFFIMFHKDKPVDWLLDHLLWVKVCNPEKDTKHCNDQKSLLKQRYTPSLFQHIGLHSSLNGKLQRLQDKDFGKKVLFQAHNNPAAEVNSSLTHYQQHTLDRAYRGLDFFWGLTPMRGDYMLICFAQPTHVKGYLFRSGNIQTNGDRLYNTTVEVLPSNASEQDQMVSGSFPLYKVSDNGFIIVGSFVEGVAEGEIEAALQPISVLRLVVQSDSDFWIQLTEIFIIV